MSRNPAQGSTRGPVRAVVRAAELAVARELAAIIASGAAEAPAPESLRTRHALSLVMVHHRTGPEALIRSMLLLRAATLSLIPFAADEPVPLLVADPQVAACNLATYLHNLFQRAMRVRGSSAHELCEATVARLGGLQDVGVLG